VGLLEGRQSLLAGSLIAHASLPCLCAKATIVHTNHTGSLLEESAALATSQLVPVKARLSAPRGAGVVGWRSWSSLSRQARDFVLSGGPQLVTTTGAAATARLAMTIAVAVAVAVRGWG
jgi:hypothetical protein